MSPPVTVAVQDAGGNTVTGDTSTVTLTLSSGTFVGGGTTATAAAVNGVATFANLAVAAPGTAPVPLDSKKGILGAAARRWRVLVVDDNVDTAEGMARLLTFAGHAVRMAHNGPAAIAVAREHRPEFVLLDIGLPGMDGYEVAVHLRREECCQDAVLVAQHPGV